MDLVDFVLSFQNFFSKANKFFDLCSETFLESYIDIGIKEQEIDLKEGIGVFPV